MAAEKSNLVVFREVTEREGRKIGSKLTKEKEKEDVVQEKASKKMMAAHLGSRFGPVIAVINEQGFHVHPTISEREKEVLRASMLGEQQETMVILKNAASISGYRRNAVLTLDVKYTPSLAQKEMERAPQLHLYLSDDVARGVTIVTDLAEEGANVLQVKMKLRMVRPSVPYDCLLNVQAYAQYKNESAQWCLNQCGYTNVSLPEALAEKKSYAQALLVNNSEHPDGDDKGTVEVRIDSFVFEGEPQEQVPVDAEDTSELRAELETSEKYARQYIQENRKQCYATVPASSESIERVTVFTFQTQSHGYVPGAYFDVFRVPKSHVEFTLKALEHGRRRSHLIDRDKETRDDVSLLDFFRGASRRACLKVIMWAAGVYVTSCTYITDEVDHNHRGKGARWSKRAVELMESFDNMITRDAGDCEDFTRAILVFVHSLKYDYGVRASEQDAPESDSDEVILRVTDMLNGFVFCSGLCGVSSMALDDLKKEQKSGERVELNGHEAAFAIPRATFLKAISRHDPSSRVAVYMQQESKRYPRYYRSDDIIYPLEGTGVLNPEPWSKSQQEKDLEAAFQELGERNSFQVMEDARTLFTYDPRGSNNFYKMFITLMTPEFMVLRGITVIEFVLYERNEHRASYRGGRHIGKRGVWFDELLNIGENEHICITGCPPLTPELEAACSALTKDNIPIWKPFTTIASAPPEWLEYERALGGPVSEQETAKTRVNYFLPAYLMSPSHVKELLSLSRASGCKLNCRLELIRQNPNGHKVGNFVISFSK